MSYKALIVDDSQTIRKIIRSNLERIGIKDILEASEGESALRTLAANNGINLMFIDYNMPVMNGLAAVKKMRENSAYNAIKIIAVSSSFDAALIESFEKLSISGFITKPFDLQKFNSSIAPILDAPVPSVGGGETSDKGMPKEDVIRLFSSEKPDVHINGKFVEFDFKNEKIKLDVDVISRYGSVYVELGE
jgi:two-component system chemotaxis response regulator CheY